MELVKLSVFALTTWLISHLGPSVSAFSFRPLYSRHRPVWSTRTTDVEDPHLTAERLFESAEFLEVVLSEHKPLGCTVEESLAAAIIELGDKTQMKLDYVFLSAVKPGGNAEKAGLLVGDVVVGVTGIFGLLENVVGLGIDKVRGLVAARSEDQPLTIRVARGTSVLNDHERALVDLCSDPTLDGKETEECIVSFLKQGYETDNETGDDNNSEVEIGEVQNFVNGANDGSLNGSNQVEEEDLIGNMLNMWAEDVDLPVSKTVDSTLPAKEEIAAKPKPWSSRSSPSGTFVRDPRTGEMRNIDS
ncbi:hypothetical protein FisN_3Lh273 [Fistulifera solaris]|uniref:PDZ domain-containing protein n=1 Tax=Fistulifera solaris TaxID=1519565 RepID=A0A1Z5JPK7_FISSO|nr:hypothetical protein FisN_3Lh273 [Fistulifera solaris]|eukprot:GAX15826.1 hypothetical protein FisN_3Lh273 [Fistulifera solaris]